jgi:polyisoprenoid-binding protein YceI
MRSLLVSLVALVALPALADGPNWDLDSAHTKAAFTVKHMMVTNVRGTFDKVSGSVTLDEANPAKSAVNATIEAASIMTGVEKRDGHLKSPDFFDVAKYPTITFASTGVTKAGDQYKVQGNLTMHGVTKPVTLTTTVTPAIKDPFGPGQRRGVEATGKVSRKDFGLLWNKAIEGGGVVVGDEIAITIDAELVTHATKAAAK